MPQLAPLPSYGWASFLPRAPLALIAARHYLPSQIRQTMLYSCRGGLRLAPVRIPHDGETVLILNPSLICPGCDET